MVDLLFLHSPTLSIPATCHVAPPRPLSGSHYTDIQARVKGNCTSLHYALIMARLIAEGIKRTRIFFPICSYQRPSACTGP
jgi:hypothetical protein